MKTADKYKYWVMLSDYDMDTIPSLIEAKRWVYVGILCQQAIERQLKGMFVYHFCKEAPKTHNIIFLFKMICENDSFCNFKNQPEFELQKNQCESFLAELTFYYVTDYPFSYKNIKDRFISENTAKVLYSDTKQCLLWLRQFQAKGFDTTALLGELTNAIN